MEWPSDYAEQFWSAYPRKVAKKPSLKTLDKIKKEGNTDFYVIMLGLKNYIHAKRETEPQFILHAKTWLNEERWNDEPDQPTTLKPREKQQNDWSDARAKLRQYTDGTSESGETIRPPLRLFPGPERE
jgi:hypothetical protein